MEKTFGILYLRDSVKDTNVSWTQWQLCSEDPPRCSEDPPRCLEDPPRCSRWLQETVSSGWFPKQTLGIVKLVWICLMTNGRQREKMHLHTKIFLFLVNISFVTQALWYKCMYMRECANLDNFSIFICHYFIKFVWIWLRIISSVGGEWADG